MDVSTEQPRIHTDIYRGLKSIYGRRDITGSEGCWNYGKEGFGPYTFDGLVLSVLERQTQQGKTEATIFDFGCGEAYLFRDFLSKKPDESKAKAFLQNYPGIKLRMVGLTDSPDVTSFNSRVSLPNGTLSNMEAYYVYYSITRVQDLEKFFALQGISDVDLALATYSLPYLDQFNFRSTLEAVVNHLTPGGGRFIASPYGLEQVPGFRDYEQGMMELHVRSKLDQPSLQRTLSLKGGSLFGDSFDLNREIELIEQAVNKYKSLKVLTDEQVNNEYDRMLQSRLSRRPRLERLKSRLFGEKEDDGTRDLRRLIDSRRSSQFYLFLFASDLLFEGERNLLQKKGKQVNDAKVAVLTNLQQQYAEQADIKFGRHTIDITKK